MNKFWVITKQVYKRRVKTKSFVISLLFPLLIAACFFAIPKIVNYFDKTDTTKIAVISENSLYRDLFTKDTSTFKVNDTITTIKSAKKALTTEKIAGFLTINETKNNLTASYTTKDPAGKTVLNKISKTLTSAKVTMKASEYQITPAQLKELSTPVSISNQVIADNQLTNKQKEVMSAAVLGLTLVIFIFVMSYANIVASEIANEKGTRIMEVILSSVSAKTHLLGKLAAILLMLLTQIGFYLLCAVAFMLIGKNTTMVQGIFNQFNNFPTYYLVLNLGFILLGLLLYILLSALIGSLVPNVETVAQFIYPMTILAIIGYWGSIAAAQAPDNLLVIIGSYIPTFSPMIMLARMDLLSVSTIGILSSLIILLLSVGAAFWLTIRLYQSNVLLYSNEGFFKTWKKSLNYAKHQ
ncbi:ABC transporter permease [Listeria sp. PSOL-1]|uniref:ABC transporter permease n=1 Tax=Listeria sp. PSOL-1 TaxID=1844999 RepID=UPI0013D41C3B|nr:ABC transporter permease [Listeria sp. PSOL-1]